MNAPKLACLRLRAPVVDPNAKQLLLQVLQQFSPRVADVGGDPQLFFLDVSGLLGLYPNHQAWAEALWQAVAGQAEPARLMVGYNRFNVFVLAHTESSHKRVCCHSAAAEAALVHALPMAAAPVTAKLCALAQELNLLTLGALLTLPQGQVASTLGAEATALHRLAQSMDNAPLAPLPLPVPCAVEASLEPPDHDSNRLLFVCKTLLPKLLTDAHARRTVVVAIDVTLVQEAPNTLCRRPSVRSTRRIEAGRPGRTEAPWLNLLRLALETWELPRAVQAVVLTAQLRAPEHQQLQLWPAAAARNSEHTSRAIGQLRACFGPHAATCAQLQPAHRPEAQFRYVPVQKITTLTTKDVPRKPGLDGAGRPGVQPLMRRLLPVPQVVAPSLLPIKRPRAVQLPQASKVPHLALLPAAPSAPKPAGPFKLSGTWWCAPCDRDYYYLPRPDGAWLWAYYDRHTRLWCLQGMVD